MNAGKTTALLSYLTFIGWIIAYLMYGSKRTSLGVYHLRQALLLHILSMFVSAGNVFFAFIPFIGWMINAVVMLAGLALFIFWILGLIYALNGEEKPVPIIGEHAQTLFNGIK